MLLPPLITLTGASWQSAGNQQTHLQPSGHVRPYACVLDTFLLSARIMTNRARASPNSSESTIGENMAVLPNASGVVRAVMNFDYDGQACANVLHFAHDPVGTAPNPAVVAGVLKTWWVNTWQSFMPTTLTLKNIIATDLTANGAPSVEYTTDLPATGTNVNVQMPNHVTVAISLRTPLRGRSYRGRLYHIGLREDMVVGNTLGPGWQASMKSSYEALLVEATGVGEPDIHWGVLSYYANKALRPVPIFTKATSINVDNTIDSMRRRLPGR